MMHFMWSDGTADYDFSDNEVEGLPWYKCFWFKGAIRQFEPGFAKNIPIIEINTGLMEI